MVNILFGTVTIYSDILTSYFNISVDKYKIEHQTNKQTNGFLFSDILGRSEKGKQTPFFV